MDHIRSRSERFARQPMFEYLRDEQIPHEQRLCFIPMMAHYVFSFVDINQYILRDESVDTPFQRLVNIHTYEDATHWPWWVADMQTAGLDKTCSFSSAMLFTWSDATRRSRLLTYDLVAAIARATPVQRLAIIETIESTGYTFLSATASACQQLDPNPYVYCGATHAHVESGHHMGTEDAVDYLETITLRDDELNETLLVVDRLFHSYTEFVDEMYDWVRTHDMTELQRTPFFREHLGGKPSRPLTTGELTDLRTPVPGASRSSQSGNFTDESDAGATAVAV
jgi:hypothetical protein